MAEARLNRPDVAVVLCVDEKTKTQIQALDRAPSCHAIWLAWANLGAVRFCTLCAERDKGRVNTASTGDPIESLIRNRIELRAEEAWIGQLRASVAGLPEPSAPEIAWTGDPSDAAQGVRSALSEAARASSNIDQLEKSIATVEADITALEKRQRVQKIIAVVAAIALVILLIVLVVI